MIYNHAAVGSVNSNNANIMAVQNFNNHKKGPSGSGSSNSNNNNNSCSGTQPSTNSNNLPRSASASATMSLSLANNNMSGDSTSNFVHYRQLPHDTSNSNSLALPSRFSRDSNRLSMQFGGDGGAKWADAADRYVKTFPISFFKC